MLGCGPSEQKHIHKAYLVILYRRWMHPLHTLQKQAADTAQYMYNGRHIRVLLATHMARMARHSLLSAAQLLAVGTLEQLAVVAATTSQRPPPSSSSMQHRRQRRALAADLTVDAAFACT